MIKLAKEVFKDKEKLITEELPEDKVNIWYQNKRMYRKIGGTDPRPFILPKAIELDEELAEALGLYVGDGKTSEGDKQHLDFASKDYDILNFMFKFFTNRLLVRLSNFTISIRYKNGNKDDILEKWERILPIPKSKFKVIYSSRNLHDTVSLQINSSILRRIFKELIQLSLPIIKENKLLRRAFLRGYFAAEGTIGHNDNENYLNYIGFSYNPKAETWLRNYCIACLEKENISSKFVERKGNKGDIIISGWQNYSKLWLIKIFDGCQRKRNRFFYILLSRNIYCALNSKFREHLFDSLKFSQRKVAGIIGSYQGNVSRTIEGRHLLRISQIDKLLHHTNISFEEFMKNVRNIRIGNGKNHISDRQFIKSVFGVQNPNQETHDS